MKYITEVASSINPWRETCEHTILSKKILTIAGLLHNSNINHLVTLPRLVVVGTQSSGKSSLLNAIIGMDILPIGSTMTTRTPITLELIPHHDSHVECGVYQNGMWVIEKNIPIQYPILTSEQKEIIRHEIESQTIKKAGSESNISTECILLKIFAPSLPLLTMTDLPGLTSVAITDRGQPKNIKEQLTNLIVQYTNSPSTLIMAIIPARPDIEADMSMELIKQVDPKGERTIGILTKLDLMNEDTDIHNYLENKVSKDLMLSYGYYGIRNKSYHTISETISSEKSYIASHPIYKQEKYQSRLGITQVANSLSCILLKSIMSALPNVIATLEKKEFELRNELIELGPSLPPGKDIRISIINGLLHTFIKQYISALETRGSGFPTAKIMNDTFSTYRSTLYKLTPFNHINDSYIHDIRSIHDGLHMSFTSLPVEIVEQCMKDPLYRPIQQLIEPSRVCLHNTLRLLKDLQNELMEQPSIKKYPNFVKVIESVLHDSRSTYYHITLERIQELISSEEQFIWTDDETFHDMVKSCMTTDNFQKLLMEYYRTIIVRIKDIVPKLIIYQLVTRANEQMQRVMYEKISQSDIMTLVEEDTEIEKKRVVLETQKKEIQSLIKKIKEI